MSAPAPRPATATPLARLRGRLWSSLTTWPDAAGWGYSLGVGAATLAAMGALGLSTGLYVPHPAHLAGLAGRLLTVLIAPAFCEEAVFRGLLVPGRTETPRPAMPLTLAVFIFVVWHMLEAETFLVRAGPVFERPDFLACAAILGVGCGLIRWRTNSLWPAVVLHWLMVTLWQTWFGGFIL